MATALPIPATDKLVRPDRPEYKKRGQKDPLAGLVTPEWFNWLAQVSANVQSSPQNLNTVTLLNQGASIGATDITSGSSGAGLYVMAYYARIARAAGTSSSLIVTLDWPDTTTPSFSGAAITGNTTTTIQSEWKYFYADGSPIRFATTYVSVGAPSMLYNLRVTFLALLNL